MIERVCLLDNPRSKNQIVEVTSAGGVVCRYTGGLPEVVVCGTNNPQSVRLPKGTPEGLETSQETALREVREETGLEVLIEAMIGDTHYSFSSPSMDADGERIFYQKTVTYYLMQPIGGNLALHDSEFDWVNWMLGEDAIGALTHKNEVQVVEDALSMVEKRSRAH